MYAYILLVAVLGSAIAAPLATDNEREPIPQVDIVPAEFSVLLKDSKPGPTVPLLSEAPASASADPAAPGLAASGAAPAAEGADAAAPALKAGIPAPKALSLISEIRSPLYTPVITPIATPILATRQIPPFIYPAITPLELAAPPATYSIEQHGYRISY